MKPLSRKNLITLSILLVVFVLLELFTANGLISGYLLFIIMIGLIYSILVVSLNVITGFTGQFSIGHAAFMAIGAYSSAVFTKLVFNIGTGTPILLRESEFLVSILMGSIVSAIAALFIGLPTLRLKGDYLCIATLGFNQIIIVILNNLDIVGGPRGFTNIPKLSTLPWIFFITVISIAIMSNFTRSIHGSLCLAVREDEVAAESLQINTTNIKVRAFLIGSFFAGTAGGLFSHLEQLAYPNQFSFLVSINILVMMVIGGAANIPGSIIAAMGLTLLPELLRFSQNLRLLLYPILLIIFMLKNPIVWIRKKFLLKG
jgi:branched-chain amino acid transport system permease protein